MRKQKKIILIYSILVISMAHSGEYTQEGVFLSPLHLTFNKKDFVGDKGFRTYFWKGKSGSFAFTLGSYCEFQADFDKIVDQRQILDDPYERLLGALVIEKAKKVSIPVGAKFKIVEVENDSHIYAQSKYKFSVDNIVIKNERQAEIAPFEEITLNGDFSFEAYCKKPPIIGWFYSLPSNFIEESFGERIKINDSERDFTKKDSNSSSTPAKTKKVTEE